jgi:hypothetical protein
MIIRAAEVLEEAFYSARRYQIRSGDPSTETLLSQPLLLEASFDIFFALGGFEALLETISVEEFQKALQNQSVPVNHLFEVVSMVLARDEAAPDTVLERTDIERRVAFTIKGEDILAGKDDKVAGTRRGPNTIRDHWDRLRISSPLIYAAKPLGDGDFMRQVLRDPSLQPWEHRIPFEVRHVWDDRRFDYGFRWVEPWLKRADEVATVLRKHKFLESWPPKDAVFPLDT